MNNNFKIVYKKPTQYDNNSISTSELDDSVLSSDSYEINKNNNQILRNNILKEINNDIISTINYKNSSLDSNTNANQNFVNNQDGAFLYNIFTKYIRDNQIDFLSLTNKEIYQYNKKIYFRK